MTDIKKIDLSSQEYPSYFKSLVSSNIKNLNISSNAKLFAYTLLNYWSHENPYPYPSISTISSDSGMCITTTYKSRQELINLGYIKLITNSKGKNPNSYDLSNLGVNLIDSQPSARQLVARQPVASAKGSSYNISLVADRCLIILDHYLNSILDHLESLDSEFLISCSKNENKEIQMQISDLDLFINNFYLKSKKFLDRILKLKNRSISDTLVHISSEAEEPSAKFQNSKETKVLKNDRPVKMNIPSSSDSMPVDEWLNYDEFVKLKKERKEQGKSNR